MLDLIAVIVLTGFVLLGVRRGALVTGLALVTLVLSYGLGVVAGMHFGPWVSGRLDLPAFLGTALAGTAGFVVSSLVLGILARQVRHWERGRRGSAPPGAMGRVGGGLLGALRGALVVVLIGWLALWLDAARTLWAPQENHGAAQPFAEESALGALTQKAVEAAVGIALPQSGPGPKLAARVLARPGATLRGVRTVLGDPRVAQLAEDQLFWTYVEQGALDAALNRASFVQILLDPMLRRRLATLGVVDAAAATNAGEFRREAKQVLAEIGPRLHRLREDPELHRLASDPEVAALIEQKNVLGLLRHPGVHGLVSHALSNEAGSG